MGLGWNRLGLVMRNADVTVAGQWEGEGHGTRPPTEPHRDSVTHDHDATRHDKSNLLIGIERMGGRTDGTQDGMGLMNAFQLQLKPSPAPRIEN